MTDSATVIILLTTALTLTAGTPPVDCVKADPGLGVGKPPLDIVLVTLDTTRADAIGVFGGRMAKTPTIDGLASRGVKFIAAVSPSPLTLPAHASLLTGLDPPEHGARDNGRTGIDATVPTLATILSDSGYSTAAFVSSRVLDHRFGLDRGFDLYDDRMVAERVGEYGYAERNAEAVTNAAITWLADADPVSPLFLWVHYYDPHSPYQPPETWRGSSTEQNYAGEISFVDHQVARLLDALPEDDGGRLVAVVGDHGESLGEHGERTHGVFLYGATLEVPLIIAGPGLPRGLTISSPVSTRRLTPTLLALSGVQGSTPSTGAPLPTSADPPPTSAEPWIYSETLMPANAYGWSPITALSGEGWRFIDAPRPELYDLKADPDELENLAASEPAQTERLRTALRDRLERMTRGSSPPVRLDTTTALALEALGYVVDGSGDQNDGIDPKDGLAILSDLGKAKQLIQEGSAAQALTVLQALHRLNPSNVPVLTYLARAQLDTGLRKEAINTYRQALSLDPGSEFLRLKLSRALARIGNIQAAKQEARRALEIDPRSASAWLHLAELSDNRTEESAILADALEADVDSALILVRLADLETKKGDRTAADRHLAEACRLAPEIPDSWLEWARVAELQGKNREAADRYQIALRLEPDNPSALLRLGIVHLRLNDLAKAREALTRATQVGSHTEAGVRAQLLLADIEAGGD